MSPRDARPGGPSAGSVLVAGATGLLGLALVRRLIACGWRVVALARGRSSGAAELSELARAGHLRLVQGDLTAPHFGIGATEWDALGRDVRWVVNCAGHYQLTASRQDVWPINVDGTRRLVEAANAWRVSSLQHVSSIAVADADEGLVREQRLARPVRFRCAYSESKWVGEEAVWDEARVPLRIVRPGVIVGRASDGVTPKFDGPYPAFYWMRRGLPFFVPEARDVPFPMVSVDTVAAVLAAGLCRTPDSEVLHAIDPGAPSVQEFARSMTTRLARHGWIVPVPAGVLKAAVHWGPIERTLGLDRVAMEWLCASARFETGRFEAFCEASGIAARRFPESMHALATYYALKSGRRTALCG